MVTDHFTCYFALPEPNSTWIAFIRERFVNLSITVIVFSVATFDFWLLFSSTLRPLVGLTALCSCFAGRGAGVGSSRTRRCTSDCAGVAVLYSTICTGAAFVDKSITVIVDFVTLFRLWLAWYRVADRLCDVLTDDLATGLAGTPAVGACVSKCREVLIYTTVTVIVFAVA